MVDPTTRPAAVSLDAIHALLSEHGYEVTTEGDSILRVKDLDSGIVMTSILEENILFNALTCAVVPPSELTPDVLRAMLSGENGIATSHFKLYERPGGKVAVTLNNFCKLQSMEDDDSDDILSCLEFLEIDAVAARDLLGSLSR